jgi:hypothetical protein
MVWPPAIASTVPVNAVAPSWHPCGAPTLCMRNTLATIAHANARRANARTGAALPLTDPPAYRCASVSEHHRLHGRDRG